MCNRLEGSPVQTHQIHVSNGRERAHEVRSVLFTFPEVIDVFVTGRSDALVVVCSGRPRPGEWLAALRSVGYHIPPRRHATAIAIDPDQTSVVATSDSAPPSRPGSRALRHAVTERHRRVKTSSPAQPAAGY